MPLSFAASSSKTSMNSAPMILRLASGSVTPRERGEIALAGVDADDLHAEVPREHVHHLVALVVAQQAVVDEHAGQLLADGLVQQRRHHRGIDAAREPEQHAALAHLGAHARDGVVDDVARRPGVGAAADVVHEALVDARALPGVRHLRMELQRVVVARLVGHGAIGTSPVEAMALESRRQLLDAIAVAHPHVEQPVALGVDAVLDVAQQRAVAARPDLGVAELADAARHHAAAELRRHGLHAVADAEHRHAELEHRARRRRRARRGHRLRAAGEDHAARTEGAHRGVAHVPGMDLAVDAELAHAARDQLRVLRAEVEDQDAVGVDVGGGGAPAHPHAPQLTR